MATLIPVAEFPDIEAQEKKMHSRKQNPLMINCVKSKMLFITLLGSCLSFKWRGVGGGGTGMAQCLEWLPPTNVAQIQFWPNFIFAFTGFIHFFRPRVQGLFKEFPGPYFEISRLFFIQIYLQLSKMSVLKSYVLGISTCTCRNARKRELENTCKPDVCCALEAQ